MKFWARTWFLLKFTMILTYNCNFSKIIFITYFRILVFISMNLFCFFYKLISIRFFFRITLGTSLFAIDMFIWSLLIISVKLAFYYYFGSIGFIIYIRIIIFISVYFFCFFYELL